MNPEQSNMDNSKRNENVDPAELAKFSALAGRWWDPESEFKPLHQINPLRLEFIEQRTSLQGIKALDVGCGGGILSESMAQRGAEVTGIDMAEAPLSVARLHALESNISVDYRAITAEQLANEQPHSFDVITCLEMLEHVPDPASTVSACQSLVRPGGSVYFSTINRNPKSFLFAIIGAEYILNLLPRGTHQYQRFIKPSELNKWCAQTGLSISEMTGMHYNPILKSYSLGPGVEVNYLVHSLDRPIN
ncbi:MAG: bifunctional 2-polyprenyl-6-hydroxyphenol methylase/3-demethylubiquinol 3-O-methyltransferase UbiG [bacterium]